MNFVMYIQTSLVTEPSPSLSMFLNTFSNGVSSPMNSPKESRPSKSLSILSKNSETSSLNHKRNFSVQYPKKCVNFFYKSIISSRKICECRNLILKRKSLIFFFSLTVLILQSKPSSGSECNLCAGHHPEIKLEDISQKCTHSKQN